MPGREPAAWLATPNLLAFAGGAVVPQGLADLPSTGMLFALVLAAVLARRLSLLPLACMLGLAWSAGHAQARLDHTLPEAMPDRDIGLTGVLASLPQRRGRATRFEFHVDPGQVAATRDFPRRIRVSWYGSHPPLKAGDRWRLRLRLKPPRGFHNPGGFDYEGWLFRRGIRATGYVREHPGNRRLGPASGPGPALQRIRQHLSAALDDALDESPRRGLVKALAVGERAAIDAGQWSVLRATGTSHLVAISGLHLGLVAGMVFTLVRRGWAWLGLAGRVAAPRVAAWSTLPIVGLYAGLAGFTVPTQRALLMVGVVLVSLLLRRALAPGRALALALVGVLLVDPLAPGSVGFWLSFAAVALILYTVAWRHQVGRRLLRMAWLQVVLGIGLAPLLVAAFQQVPLAGPLANFVAVPVVGMAVVPLVLLGTLLLSSAPGLAEPLLRLADRLLAATWYWLEACTALPFAETTFATPPLAWVVLAGLGVVLLLVPRGLPVRLPGLVLLLPMLTFQPAAPAPGAAWLTLLDVGQGLAAVVRTANRTLIFDTGPRYSARLDAGSAAIVPMLRSLGVARVDALVVSHGDGDHAGGMSSVLAALEVDRLFVGHEVSGADRGAACRAGQRWHWDGVEFAFLHPGAGGAGGNDGSCVLRVSTAGASLLLTGDIEADAERRLLAADAAALRVDVLQVPHHGSRTSSTPRFVAATAPRVALVSSGWRNRYGLPDEGVVARYVEAGSAVVDTAAAGAVEVRLPRHPGPLDVRRHRVRERRFWHAR